MFDALGYIMDGFEKAFMSNYSRREGKPLPSTWPTDVQNGLS
jgi:hypothetical protein